MRRRFLALFVPAGLAAFSQFPDPLHPVPEKEPDGRLPNGKIQKDEIVKADHEKSLEDAANLTRLAGELQHDLDKEGSFVVSVQTIRKTEEIEKIARRIRGRLKRN